MKKKYLTTTILAIFILVSGTFFFWLKNRQKQTAEAVTVPVIVQPTKTPILPTLPPVVSLTPTEKIVSIQQTEKYITSTIEENPDLSYMADEYINSIADSYLEELSNFNKNNFLDIFLNGEALAFAQEKISTYQNQNLQIKNMKIEALSFAAVDDGYQQTILVETKENQSGQFTCKHETIRLRYFFNPQISIWQINQIEILNSKVTDCLYL
ncbi:MAG: hypothetical protein Q4G02_02415 [bacterium]|nr:hypothetical protein [bacterium]